MQKIIRLAKYLIPAILAVVVAAVLIGKYAGEKYSDYLIEEEVQQAVNLLYGIEYDNYDMTEGTISGGQTLGAIFNGFGVGASRMDRIARQAEDVFSVKKIQAGKNYTAFQTRDSLSSLAYFVYEISHTEFLVFDLTRPDTVDIYKSQKEIRLDRVTRSATINSSLYNAVLDNGMSAMLARELEDIYAWSIDFFGLQKGDNFTVVYDEQYVDSTRVGNGTIWGAWFEHNGKVYYAIPFIQDGKLGYWDENGNSLRKAFLKAPLQFSRISSRFSNSRLHPILKVYRAHYGVDYAAPAGTPVVAVADGVVTHRAYDSGGGNTVKIKHSNGKLVSGYLHLSRYGDGIAVGKTVRQGQTIGYVGSTGLSTGPHLDFRLWQNGTPIDPLKVPNEPVEPVHESNRLAFHGIRDRVLAELRGELPDSLRVISLEITADTTAVRQAVLN